MIVNRPDTVVIISKLRPARKSGLVLTRLKTIRFIAGVLALVAAACSSLRADLTLRVSPDPRSGGGLATAITKVSLLRRDPAHAAEKITIAVDAGVYYLDRPLLIPSSAGPLTITAAQGQTVVLSGGIAIGNWGVDTFNGHACWSAEVPAVRLGLWYFRELWVNRRRAIRARYPSHGYLHAQITPIKEQTWNTGQNWFGFKPDKMPDVLPPDSEAIIGNRWAEAHLAGLTVDPANHVIRSQRMTPFQLENGDPYWLEGSREWLTEPGEFYLDRQAGKVYYLPRDGENLAKLEVVASRLTTLINVQGGSHVTFSGIAFSNTEWSFAEPTPSGQITDRKADGLLVGGFGQADLGVPASVIVQHSHDCVFDHCTFEHIGNWGLELGTGCRQNRVEHCTFTDLGAGGLKIGDGDPKSAPTEQAFGNVISDCRITDGGKQFASACGIWVGESYDNHIEHNEIANFFYTGLSMGWTWGYGKSLCRGNVVEANLVHDIGKKSDGDGPLLSDMGGIYTLGVQPGTVIRGNIFHDITARVYGGWGIYLDEGSSNITVEKNLVYRTTHGGFHQHYGRDNLVTNNIFALGRDVQIARTRAEATRSFTFTHNIVYWRTGVFTETSPGGLSFDQNLYDCPDAVALRFGDRSWKFWQSAGRDRKSSLSSAGFVPGDEAFIPSPAAMQKIEFEPLDLRGAGAR